MSKVSVRLVKIVGSAPQVLGAKMEVGIDGLIDGSVGGGRIEKRAIEYAQELLLKNNQAFDYVEWNLQKDIGMTCGGVVGLFFELMKNETSESHFEIAVFGAGHVAQELVPLLLKLDCKINVFDPRADWLNKMPTHNKLIKNQIEKMEDVVKSLNPKTFIVSVTMGHAFDLPILLEAAKNGSFPFVGVIGSPSKAVVLKNDLLKSGVDTKFTNNLSCPIGEDFGNNTPVEIAFSIIAQLLKARDRHFLVD